MNKKYFILIPVVAAVLFMMNMFMFNFSENKQGSEVSQNNNNSQINNAVLPLYPDATWSEPMIMSDDGGDYWEVVSSRFTDIENIYEVAGPFADYYNQKLVSTGWVRNLDKEASGPGSNVSYYTKDGQFIAISYDSYFKKESENAPSECPCDLIFTITNGLE